MNQNSGTDQLKRQTLPGLSKKPPMYLPDKRTFLVLLATFIVALCSLVYELLFSQMLTVIFGGTLVRYSITIGLFLFSLGIGALLYRWVSEYSPVKTLVVIELLLPLAGCIGLVGIIALETLHGGFWASESGYTIRLVLSHAPIVIVGILSGLEIPLLSALLDRGKYAFSEVLGVDYFGGLVGTLVYALLLYPGYGLFTTALVIAFLNVVVAVIFAFTLSGNRFWPGKLCTLGLAGLLLVGLMFHQTIDYRLNRLYMGAVIEQRYRVDENTPTGIVINDVLTTPYQQVVQYDLPGNIFQPPDRCLNLDSHVQMCDSWYRDYHEALVNVPMQLFESTPSVLVLGGGDYIAARFLSHHGAEIDLIDIDRKFRQYSQDNAYVRTKNRGAFNYKKLTVYNEDAFAYAKHSKTKYDLILFDLPGVEHDKLSHLYSVEFFSFLKRRLTDDGAIALWVYQQKFQPRHHAVFLKTLAEAGFEHYKPYSYYRGSPNAPESGQLFYLLSKTGRPEFLNRTGSIYFSTYRKAYSALEWLPIKPDKDVRAHRVFLPNYDIVVKPVKPKQL